MSRVLLTCLLMQEELQTPLTPILLGLKGVALEAWTMKQIDMESYHHIKQIKNVRGERIPKGRALERHEVAQLFKVCDEDSRCKGVRDSAIFGVLLGCGLRRGEIVVPRSRSI